MIGLEDSCHLVHDIHTAHSAGARLRLACQTAGIDVRTLQRWQAQQGLINGDGRPQAMRPAPAHAEAHHAAHVVRQAALAEGIAALQAKPTAAQSRGG